MPADNKNYCPFGCELANLDEYGYCPHLVGFTNDGNVFEPVQKIMTAEVNEETGMKTGQTVDSGRRRVLGGKKCQPIQKTDKLINPTFNQLVNGIYQMAKSWVSDRVYRNDTTEIKKAG